VKKNVIRQLAVSAELSDTPIPTQPLVEIAGTGRVLIENDQGVTCYEPSVIQVKTKTGQIRVEGESLELSCMTRGKLVILGQIRCVSLFRG
jgi:sporulation protein YqfC